MKIGIVGESPNDTKGLEALLKKGHEDQVFKSVFGNRKQHHKAHKKLNTLLKIELKSGNYDAIVVSTDLDDHPSQTEKIRAQKDWFNKVKKDLDVRFFLLLHIYEIEALILSDIKSVLTNYGGKCSFSGNPMMQKDPKEFLEKKWSGTKFKYKENKCPEILAKLDYAIVKYNCAYFKAFDKALTEFIIENS
ncbi:MAG: hypothetical protein ACPGLV_01630 [Bacteroidia bacterium]